MILADLRDYDTKSAKIMESCAKQQGRVVMVQTEPDDWFERSAQLCRAGGDVAGEAAALFWVGCCHQLVRRDNDAAVPVLQRSLELATQVGDKATMSEALRHLGIADYSAGRLDSARQRLEESSRLAGRLACCRAWPRTWSGSLISLPPRVAVKTPGRSSTRRPRSPRLRAPAPSCATSKRRAPRPGDRLRSRSAGAGHSAVRA